MRLVFKNKFVIVLTALAVTTSAVFYVTPAQAQGIPGVGGITGNKVPVIDSSVLQSISGSGSVLGQAADVVALIKGTLTSTCQSIINTATISGESAFLRSLGSSTFSVVGGSEVEAGILTAETARLEAAYTCINLYLDKLTNYRTTNLQAAADIARQQQTFSSIRDALSQRIDAKNARATASWKDVLRAVLTKVILNVNKNLTTSLVNKMVEKYKISDYLAYGDALTSQVYSMKYINDNYQGDARQQMIIRSLLQSDKLPEKIKTAQAFATSKAKDYLGAACGASATPSFNQNLDSYIKCLGAYGSAPANPQYHYLQAIDQAQAAKGAGRANTNYEISQSNGFAPPRTCKNTLAMQKDIDTKYDKVAADLQIATAARTSLEKALKLTPPRTTQVEYQKAVDAEAQAKANEKALGSQISKPIIDICEAIDTPPSFVSSSIGDFLKQHLDQTSQLKSDNLPFYATFLADVAGNFLTNILTGGKSNSQVLKEAGTAALISSGGILSSLPSGGGTGSGSGGSSFPQGQLIIYAFERGLERADRVTELTPGKNYTVVVDFVELITSNPYKINIDGGETSIPSINRVLTTTELGEERITFDYTATTAPFTISSVLYGRDVAGQDKVLASKSQNFTISGQVRGASNIMPRGPEVNLR